MNHLVVTVGQSDLQVVAGEGPDRRRLKIRKDFIRAFHEALAAGTVPYSLAPFEETLQLEENRVDLQFQAETGRLLSGLDPDASSDPVEIDARAGVVLAAPLVSRILADPRLRQVRFGSVLFLNTKRRNRREEPVAVFQVLQGAVAARLGLHPRNVNELLFLVDDESLYEEDDAGQTFLLSAASRRIDEAFVKLKAASGPDKAVFFVSDTGGLPDAKAVVAAAARYRADEVRFVGAVETRPGNRETRKLIAVGPAESLNLRRHVRRLVRMGAFPEAAALAESSVAEKTHAESQEPWRRWLRQAAATLTGVRPDGGQKGKIPPLLEEIFKMGPGLWVAFRVESAVRSGDWREALRWQFTFSEIVMDEFQKRLMRREAEHGEKPREIVDQWPDSKEKSAFVEFIRKLMALREARNRITHGWADEREVRMAVEEYYKNSLWRRNPPSFLSQEPAKALVRALTGDIRPVDALYQGLIDAILSDMDEFSLQDPPAG